MSRKFNFKAFAGLVLIRIYIALQLIDWCHGGGATVALPLVIKK